MSRAVFLAILTSFACTSSGGAPQRDHYVDSLVVPVDCHASPGNVFALAPAHPAVAFTDDRVTTDGGATWRGVYDGVRLVERMTPPEPLGDGRWFTIAEPKDNSGKYPCVIDPATARAKRLAFENVAGPVPAFLRAKVDATMWVGLDGMSRVWTSADGATWTGRDQRDAAWVGTSFIKGMSAARGQRVWSVSAQDGDGKTELRVSTDGGATFTPRELPEVQPGERYKQIRYLALGSGGRAVIGFFHPGVTAWLWLTEDDGLTWHLAGGDPEWIERTGVNVPAVFADDTLVLNSEQNIDAARPEPPGFYLVRSTDWGKSWTRLVLKANGVVVPPSVPVPVMDLGGGRFAVGTSRPLTGAEAVNGPGVKTGWCTTAATGAGSFVTESAEEPARTAPAKPTITSPASMSRVSSPVHVTGRGVPGGTVAVKITGAGRHFDGISRFVPDDLLFEATATIGVDGAFAVDVPFLGAIGGSTLGVSATQSDGYLTSDEVVGLGFVVDGPPPPPLPVILRPTSSKLRTPFHLSATATPGAQVKTWVVDQQLARRELSLANLPVLVPASGELEATVDGLANNDSLYLGVETAGGLAFTSLAYTRWDPGQAPQDPASIDAPPANASSPLTLSFVRVEPYALLHLVLRNGAEVLAERHDVTFEWATTGTATLTYAEPPSGTVLRLRLWQTNEYGASRETEWSWNQR